MHIDIDYKCPYCSAEYDRDDIKVHESIDGGLRVYPANDTCHECDNKFVINVAITIDVSTEK